jgi:hypothetical protein
MDNKNIISVKEMIEIIHENEFIRRTSVNFYNKNIGTTISMIIFHKGYTCVYGAEPVEVIMTQLDYGWAIINFEKVKEICWDYNEIDDIMSYIIYLDNGDYYIIEMWEKLKKDIDKSDNVC